ncbi:MAG: histidine phosphatase family protein [Acidobacteriota bacterium]|nr:MAG: histidine phosphatase family protein [Acidobacteriota bacterium]
MWLRSLNWSWILAGFCSVCVLGSQLQAQEPTVTTVFLVRHAEKIDSSRDPDLAPEGRERADRLRDLLQRTGASALFATQFKRTQQTLQPLSTVLGVPVAVRQAQALNELVDEVKTKHPGETVVLAGHSDTVPELIRLFSGTGIDPLGEDDYDNLFILFVTSEGLSRLVRLTY